MPTRKKRPRKGTKARLAEIKERIDKEIPFIDLKPYSHNIISLNLRLIAQEFGYATANEVIDELDLRDHGREPETELGVQEALGTIDGMKKGKKK